MTTAPTLSPTPAPLDIKGRRIHFAGIGGCGMSGLARIIRSQGAICTGSDLYESETTQALIAEGIPVVHEQTARTLPEACDLLINSAALGPAHPEVAEAARRGVPTMKYAQALGRMMIGRLGIAIAGTHGKSTTTAMLAHVLIQSGQDPSFIVGATCAQIGGGCRIGRPDMLLAEACEYDRSFHNFHPTHAAILNVEEDHLDIYGNLQGVLDSFRHFASLISPDGSLLIGHKDSHRTMVAAGARCPVQTIGYAPQADWVVESLPSRGNQTVLLSHQGQRVCRFDCHMPGEHMAYNACVAAVMAHRIGVEWPAIGQALSTFLGLDRRMQRLDIGGPVTVVDDYGHHPTEIETTLRALRNHYRPDQAGRRLICIFQPHQHSRTRFLLEQFASSFSHADVVIVPHIYFVRDSEQDRKEVRAEHLVEKLNNRGVKALHIDEFADIVQWLKKETRPGDLLVVMGAGPVFHVAHDFVAQTSGAAAGPPHR